MRVLDVAGRVASQGGASTVVLCGRGRTLTRGELQAEVDARVAGLRGEGARDGRLHPAILEGDLDGVLTLLATWRLGAVPVPLNPRLTRPEREAALLDLVGAPDEGSQAVLWTSGTSGSPRGVALGRTGLEAHLRAVTDRLALDGSEVWLASLSPAHVGGLALIVRALLTGAVLVAAGSLDVHALVRTLKHTPSTGHPPITHLSLVPTQLDRLLTVWGGDPPPPALRCILVGGAHAPDDLVQRALGAGWPIALTYGMTEMWSQVATAPPDLVRAHPGTVGPPLDGVEMRFTDEGELLVRGPTQALGYVGREAGAATLTDADGWYHTGDLGLLDDRGLVRVTGRRSERIISGGVNVDPLEVEDALRAHPAVRDAAVVGVPSREWGETVAALVVPVWEAFELAEVEAFVRTRLTGAKRPRIWKVDAELPRNANGKVDRKAVARAFESH